MWLGSAPEADYTAGRVHFNFRWVNDYAPGYITDWGAHFLDVAQWGNGTDDTTPVEVVAHDLKSRAKGYYDAPESFRIEYRYANGVVMTMVSTDDKTKWGINFVGTKGSVFTENTTFRTEPDEISRIKIKDSDTRLYESVNHHLNFVDCIKSRERTAATAEASHRAATCCHLGTIAAATGRALMFDPAKEKFVDDEAANKMVMREMRGPWKL
jgi:predicted dehydrogenase